MKSAAWSTMVIFLAGLLGSVSVSYAQTERIWVLGGNIGLDFNADTANPSVLPMPGMEQYLTGNVINEALASVTDKNGNLLFYTDGRVICGSDFMRMPNGFDLAGINSTSSSSQGATIVPMPDSAYKYYVFSLSDINSRKLYYSIVDMRLNGGKGDVLPGYKGILLDSSLSEKVTAYPAGQRAVWVMAHDTDTPLFKAYRVDGSGLNPVPVRSYTGYPMLYDAGKMEFSPDGSKVILTGGGGTGGRKPYGGLELFDFDVTSGRVSNPVLLDTPSHVIAATAHYRSYYSVRISPFNTKVYATCWEGTANTMVPVLYQFDICGAAAQEWAASRQRIGNCLGFSSLKYGPDWRIYLYAGYTRIGRINQPEGSGVSCLYDTAAILMPNTPRTIFGAMPNDVPGALAWDTSRRLPVEVHHGEVRVCFQDSMVLQAGEGKGYIWDNGDTGKTRSVSGSGVFAVSYQGYCNNPMMDSFRVTFGSGALPAVSSTTVSCRNEMKDTIHLTPRAGDTTYYTYTWYNEQHILLGSDSGRNGTSLQGIGPGDYKVRLVSAAGCDTVLPVTVPALPDYHVSFAADTVVCQDALLSFENTSTGPLSDWRWLFGDGDSADIADPVHHYTAPGRYKVMLTGSTATSCADTFRQWVTVDSLPYVSFTTSRELLCEGDTVRFLPHYRSGATALLWDYGDAAAQDTNGIAAVHTYDQAGTMIIALTARYRACPDTTFRDTLQVTAYPLVSLGPDTSLCPDDPPLQLVNLAAPEAESLHHTWSTGATTESISVSWPGGVYYLSVRNASGCTTTDTARVGRSCETGIPNVFTPDGDGINDYFYPRALLSRGLRTFRMQVYNRWGTLLYETSGLDGRGWDGRYNGVMQPQGVYVYRIEVSFRNGAYEQYQGNVSLLR